MYPSVFSGLAAITCLLAVSVFYLGCPNQQWRSQRPLRFYPALFTSLLLVALGWSLFLQALSALSASFTVFCLIMLGLGLVPFTGILDKPGKVLLKQKKRIQKGLSGYKPRWWLKSLCGVFLGLPLAIGIAGLIAWWGPGEVVVDDKTQLVMWLITPIWLTCLSLVYLSVNSQRLLTGYAGLNFLVFGLLSFARSGG